MKRFRWGENGFTLMELLIVIAIMAVLGGVAIGALTGLIGSGTPEAKASEKAAVQTAVDAYMSASRLTAITARVAAAVIAAGDVDAPFNIYIRALPTKYLYSWTVAGVVTQTQP